MREAAGGPGGQMPTVGYRQTAEKLKSKAIHPLGRLSGWMKGYEISFIY